MIRNFYVVAALAIIAMNSIRGNHLIGEHVCTKNKTYTVTFEKAIRRNVTKREFVWCMGVPPRCSKYITREVDDIQIVKEDRVRKIDNCCVGYIEDKSKTYCIPECKFCVNGICTAPEVCTCSAGYAGASCNQTCESGSWGQNCSETCACVSGVSCSSETGSCTCEPGTTGSKCEIFVSNKTSNCTFEECESSQPTVETETKESDIIAILPSKSTKNLSPFTMGGSTGKPEAPTPLQGERREVVDYNASIARSKKNFNSIGKIPQFLDKESEKWQMDQVMIENSSENSVINAVLVFVISVAVGIAVILILVTIMTCMIARYKKQRDLAIKNVLTMKSSIDSNKNRLSTEPIIRRSVFHAPLPDPPLFQNPVFTLQDFQNTSKIQLSIPTNTPSPETLSQYDFPPSSGSYRAVSLPDPSIETVPEPLYDEIPASRWPRPVSGIAESRQSWCGNAHCQWNNT